MVWLPYDRVSNSSDVWLMPKRYGFINSLFLGWESCLNKLLSTCEYQVVSGNRGAIRTTLWLRLYVYIRHR